MRSLVTLALVGALGCQPPPVSLENRACPCVEGWRCNPALGEDGECVPEVAIEYEPSHVSGGLANRGFTSVVVEGAHWVVDTDDGSITSYDDLEHTGEPTQIRAAGEGSDAGIGFAVVAGRYGVFSLDGLEIATDASVVAVGSRALVLLVVEEALVAGLLSVGAERVPDRPGAGGHRGVEPIVAGCSGTTPVGPPGSGISSLSGAGGGGTYGSCGAEGGGSPGSCAAGGGILDVDALRADWFVGGFGGGASGSGSCSQLPPGLGVRARGGHGGGALQVSAGIAIYVLEGGTIDARGGGGLGGAGPAMVGSLFDVSAGSGGGSGGAVLLEAPTLTLSGAVTAAGGGGGGGGGFMGEPSMDGPSAAGTAGLAGRTDGATAEGGTCPLGVGGGAGSDRAGTATPGRAVPSCEPCEVRGGGGGGGAGVIVLRAADPSAIFDSGLGFTSPERRHLRPLDGEAITIEEWPTCPERGCCSGCG